MNKKNKSTLSHKNDTVQDKETEDLDLRLERQLFLSSELQREVIFCRDELEYCTKFLTVLKEEHKKTDFIKSALTLILSCTHWTTANRCRSSSVPRGKQRFGDRSFPIKRPGNRTSTGYRSDTQSFVTIEYARLLAYMNKQISPDPAVVDEHKNRRDLMYTKLEIGLVLRTDDRDKYCEAIIRAPHIRKEFSRFLERQCLGAYLDLFILAKKNPPDPCFLWNRFFSESAPQPINVGLELQVRLANLYHASCTSLCQSRQRSSLHQSVELELRECIRALRLYCQQVLDGACDEFLESDNFFKSVQLHNTVLLSNPQRCHEGCGRPKTPLETQNQVVSGWHCNTAGCAYGRRISLAAPN